MKRLTPAERQRRISEGLRLAWKRRQAMTNDEAIQLAGMLRHTPEYGGTLMKAEIAAVVLAAELERLQAENVELREAMEELMLEQNGPPLIKNAKFWKAAMDHCEAILRKTRAAAEAAKEKP